MSYSIPTPPSSIEDSPQPALTYCVASPTSNVFILQNSPGEAQAEYTVMNQDLETEDLMDFTVSSSVPAARLCIVEQPTDKFRFRYKSEMAGTHGSLTGINSDKSRKQTFPTVELKNVTEPAVVRCSIYQINCDNKENMPHAHRLIMKRGKEEYDDPHNISVGPKEGYIASFHSMGIIHTAKKHLISELIRKKTHLKKEQIARMEGKLRDLNTKETCEIKGLAECESKSINLNIVCLRFDAFKVHNDIWHPICPPVFSHGINNLKSALTGELKIVRLDHCTSPAKGGKEIFVLVERVTKKNIKIRFFELNDEDQEVWHDYGRFNDLDVHHQYAIVFKTPKYKDEKITRQVKVFVELLRPSDNARSEPKEFMFVPSHEYRPGVKRARPSYYTSSSSFDSSHLASDEIPAPVLNINTMPEILEPSVFVDDILSDAILNEAINNVGSEEFRMVFKNFEREYISTAVDAGNVTTGYQFQCRSTKGNAQSAPALVKMELDDNDFKDAKRMFEELQKFAKSNYTTERAVQMLNYYLGVENKTNALHVFISINKVEEVNFLLKMIVRFNQKALVNVRDSEGRTALHLAVICNNYQFVTYLIKCDADVSATDANGNNALHTYIEQSNFWMIFEILLSGKEAINSVNMTNNDGNIPLISAIEKGNLKVVKCLCAKGADINKKHNKNGFTPLRFAIEKQNFDIVEFLLSEKRLNAHDQHDFNNISPFVVGTLKSTPQSIRDLVQKYMDINLITAELKQEITEDDSEEDMEQEEIDIKPDIIPPNELETLYQNITFLTTECLDEISEILDTSGNWEELANLLALGHMINSGLMSTGESMSKKLLKFAVENHENILEIRNVLEYLNELKAVEALDKMAKEVNGI